MSVASVLQPLEICKKCQYMSGSFMDLLCRNDKRNILMRIICFNYNCENNILKFIKKCYNPKKVHTHTHTHSINSPLFYTNSGPAFSPIVSQKYISNGLK